MNTNDFRLSFRARGDRYKPSQIGFAFASQHDVGDPATRGRYKGAVYPYGASEIRVPDSVPRSEIVSFLVESVKPLLPAMTKAGADDFYVSAAYYFETQCNLEFSPDELAKLASLGCTFALSCYPANESAEEIASEHSS